MLYIFDIPRFFGWFCPSLVGGFIISRCMAFFVVSGYLCGFSSFRRSVGLLVRCFVLFLVTLAPFPAVVPDLLPGSDALPVLASYIARCGRLLWFGCRSSSVTASGVLCGFPCVALDAGSGSALGVVSLYEFGRVLGVVVVLVCSACPGAVLGIICPLFFRVPFRILCGFFCCHCPIIPGAGRRSRLPFSASGVV